MNKENPLLELQTFGQSVWLDYLRRSMLSTGELQRLIDQDGLRGITSNPSILEKAIAGSHDYDDAVKALALEGKDPEDIYLSLVIDDIQRAADLFKPIYEQTGGRDGFVSLEVSPHLAHDSNRTVTEARRLWSLVDRSNAMIKVPATLPGLSAIQQLIGEGINVNVTLLFSLSRYRQVAEAFIAGLEARAARGQPLERVVSVASFFLSRIDTRIDAVLEKLVRSGRIPAERARRLQGQLAIASAKAAYQTYLELKKSPRFRKLADRGAQMQRLLWASTSTKNPSYSDVRYVEALIGQETITTVPIETLNAYRDHGKPKPRLEEGVIEAQSLLLLAYTDLELDRNLEQLEEEGIQKFIESFDRLIETLKEKRDSSGMEPVNRQSLHLGIYEPAIREQIAGMAQNNFCRRLWQKDASLWKTDPRNQDAIRNSLGWLHVAEKMEEQLDDLNRFVSEVKAAGFRHVVHIGMGGSSLAPLVFARIFQNQEGGLPFTVLDTTDPATILRAERSISIADTLFIIASKSGTTDETLALGNYFYTRVKDLKGDRAGDHFVAITDPGTPLVTLTREGRYRRIFFNFFDVGGRYSALSFFGLVPAALIGVDVKELLARSLRMVHACADCVHPAENPGLTLGATLGELYRHGRDKVTLLVGKSIAAFGLWVEQLLAESTGKEKRGILPVVDEPVGQPIVYGADRLFVHIRLRDEEDPAQEQVVAALEKAGHPVIVILLDDLLDLGQEFIRWEVATATVGSILGINVFNQPDVQESKENTKVLLSLVCDQGQLPEPEPSLVEGPLRLYAGKPSSSIAQTLVNFLSQARPGDYLALMVYLEENQAIGRLLNEIRLELRDRLQLATTLGYGPRYLHSTGQFHKGGPNNGLFLQLTADDVEDIPVPGDPYTFGTFKRAQVLGDWETLQEHGQRILRVHLGPDAFSGLEVFRTMIQQTLGEITMKASPIISR